MDEGQDMYNSSQDGYADNSDARKLAIFGLPWDTSDETFRMYFAQFGPLEAAEVMKDRYSGKSRGFGFVTFVDVAAARQALRAEHVIDGRRCEAKVAVPKGEPTQSRTTRIFVARISPSVTEAQFRSYFEQFGMIQDAYMPKDHAKQGYRGIGFVTFASPDSVDNVMASKHWLDGTEVAVDRANPKEYGGHGGGGFFDDSRHGGHQGGHQGHHGPPGYPGRGNMNYQQGGWQGGNYSSHNQHHHGPSQHYDQGHKYNDRGSDRHHNNSRNSGWHY